MAALAVFGIAKSAAVAGHLSVAAELFGSGRVICAAMGAQADRLAGPSETRSLQEARLVLGDQTVAEAWATGRGRTADEAAAAGLAAAAELASQASTTVPPTPI